MAQNSNLSAAKRAKNDEFYTQLTDIEKELSHYKEHFKGKTVFCNCDDPFESNFFKYFLMQFNALGLKKLLCMSYADSAIQGREFVRKNGDTTTGPYLATVTNVVATDMPKYAADPAEVFKLEGNSLRVLKGDGDFRSQESLRALEEADIVVTNPPFSLFREYIALLIEHNKKFLVVGNKNSITYKEIFPLIKDNKLWLGFGGPNLFFTPNGMTSKCNGLSRWFTNLDIKKRHEEMILYKRYNPEEYPKYDNYNAINVDKVKDIPEDYFGIMGVPITFVDSHCEEQFEIIGLACGNSWANYREILLTLNFNPNIKYGGGLGTGIVNGNPKYARILIRRRQAVSEAA